MISEPKIFVIWLWQCQFHDCGALRLSSALFAELFQSQRQNGCFTDPCCRAIRLSSGRILQPDVSPHVLGKLAQRSASKIHRNFTTKIPNALLQSGWAKVCRNIRMPPTSLSCTRLFIRLSLRDHRRVLKNGMSDKDSRGSEA